MSVLTIADNVLIGLQNQTAAWVLVGIFCLLALGWFGFVAWVIDVASSRIYRTDDEPVPTIIVRPRVKSLTGSAAKGFDRHQQLGATIITFRRIH